MEKQTNVVDEINMVDLTESISFLPDQLRYEYYSKKDITDDVKNMFWQMAQDILTRDNKDINREEIRQEYQNLLGNFYPFYVYGMKQEHRFNPSWHRDCVQVYKEELPKIAGIESLRLAFDISGDEPIHGNFEDVKNELIKEYGCNEKEAGYYINFIKEKISKEAQNQKGSCQYHNINDKLFSFILISPYRNKIDTLHTMFHETTHHLQSYDEENKIKDTDYLQFDGENVKEQLKNLQNKYYDLNYNSFKLKQKINEEKDEKKKEELQKQKEEIVNHMKEVEVKYKKTKTLFEVQANIFGSMAVFLQALNNGESKEVLDDIQRKLLLTANSNYSGEPFEGCYCDFSLTKNILQKLREDEDFRNSFINEKDIDYKKIYNFSFEQSQALTNSIEEFAYNNGKNLITLAYDENLMKNDKNPVYQIQKEHKEYFKTNKLTERERIEDAIHSFRATKDIEEYKKIKSDFEQLKKLNQVSQAVGALDTVRQMEPDIRIH